MDFMKLCYSLFALFLCLTGIGLTSCSLHRLSVQKQYLTHENLASYTVGTPDFRLDNPSVGERLVISWSLPKCEKMYESLTFKLRVHFRNRVEDQQTRILEQPSGYYVYNVRDEKFCQTGGILTYKVDLFRDGILLEEFRHPLWVELIQLNIAE
jgi:hypothetical protein